MSPGYLGVGSSNLMPPKMIKTSPIKSYSPSSFRIVKELGMNSEHLNISNRFALYRINWGLLGDSYFYVSLLNIRRKISEKPSEKLMSPFLVENHLSNKAGDQSLFLSPFLVQNHEIKLEDMKKLMEIFIQSDFKPFGLNNQKQKPAFNYQTKFQHKNSRWER